MINPYQYHGFIIKSFRTSDQLVSVTDKSEPRFKILTETIIDRTLLISRPNFRASFPRQHDGLRPNKKHQKFMIHQFNMILEKNTLSLVNRYTIKSTALWICHNRSLLNSLLSQITIRHNKKIEQGWLKSTQ
jgi:hypothetical protein